MAPLHLAVALDGAGWHPAAWRADGARPGDLFTARYWTDLVRTAEAGLLDEAADAVEVVRRLRDSGEDGAGLRDAATNRPLDRDEVHHVDVAGRFFSRRGPGIVPRPPQTKESA